MNITPAAHEVIILGMTAEGRRFRPSDWAQRLAGVAARFRPGGGDWRVLGYSPWCTPTRIDGAGAVIVHTDLRDNEPMAWDFLMGFAHDNYLQCFYGEAAAPTDGNNP